MELNDIYHVIETNRTDDLNRYLDHDWKLISTAVHGDMDSYGVKSEYTVYSVGCSKVQFEFYKDNPKEFTNPDFYDYSF